MTSRRQFIRQAAIAAGGLMLYRPFLANASSSPKKKVIIIGAGFAGLMAGYTLFEKGIDFEILEARKRIGGRVHSRVMGQDEFVVELGAEWVGADHELMIGLCRQFGLPLENNMFRTEAIYNGRYYRDLEVLTNPAWELKFKELLKNYRQMDPVKRAALDKELDKTDWWRYLLENGCPERDLDLRDLADSTDFGESIREVSALAAIGEYASNIKSTHNQMDYKIQGGNSRLAETFRQMFPDRIRTGCRVERVVQASKATVHCNDGYETTGDKLICTAPTFAVSRIHWEPALPEGMVMALHGLEYARINKNAILFTERFWERDDFDMITDMPGHYFYHATKNQTANRAGGVLVSYTIGDKAAVIASQQEYERINLAGESLKIAYPHAGRLAVGQEDYYWGNDNYSKGAYAVYGKGQWFDLYPKLKARHMHTHFAGEHLSDKWGGFMEGALETGQAAANKVAGWVLAHRP